jgi:glycosyltransferase involved in cell wall biosynthesis
MLKFSIIIPIYNAARFLATSLNSCVRQTYSNIEVICVDDFSKDSSRELIRSFQDRDKRIIGFFHEKNESQYIARRTGIINATGDYILFLDSDDALRHDACELLANRIARTGADMIQFGYKETPGGKKMYAPFYNSSKERITAYLAKENRYSPEVWTKAYSRALIQKAYNVMEVFYASGPEDVYTSIAITYFAESFAFLKKPLVNYSIGSGMSTKKQYSLHELIAWMESYKTVIQKTRVFIQQYMSEFTEKCNDMEVYLLNDFLFSRLLSNSPVELKYQVFDLLPSYFSKDALYACIETLTTKTEKYDAYINFNGSFKSKSKKLVKTIQLYLKSLF